jgi:chromosome segregation ATPase
MSEQIENLEEDILEDVNDSLSPKDKERESRSSVRKELREQRQLLKELRRRLKNGENLTGDIEACEGHIELLYKELQSIEDGGHTTFLEAKEVIAPKMNYAAKKENLKDRIKLVKKEIHELEESLFLPNLPDVTRDETMIALSRLKKEQEDLAEEMNALLQFNHTRFVEAREESKGQKERAEKELNLQTQLRTLQQELADANNKSDLNKANELISAISELQEEIKDLDRPDEDAFLEKFDDDTVDPFLER